MPVSRKQQILDRKNKILKRMDAILEASHAAGREDLNAEEGGEYGQLEQELGTPRDGDKAATGIFLRLEREERLADQERTLLERHGEGFGDPGQVLSGGEKKRIKIQGLRTRTRFYKSDEDAYLAGVFFRAVETQEPELLKVLGDHGVELLAAPSVGSNSAGAILLPDFVANTVIILRERVGVFRSAARNVPLLGESLSFPRALTDIDVYFVGEGEEPDESDAPTNDDIKLVPRELCATLSYPKRLAESALIAYADYITQRIAYAFAKREDQCGFIGDGTKATYGRIHGLVPKIDDGNHTAGVVAAAAGHTAFGTLTLADFAQCVGTLPDYGDEGSIAWYISKAGWASSMLPLLLGIGGATVTDAQGKISQSFLGYPVRWVSCMNRTLTAQASKVLALLGDLSLSSTLGDSQQLAITVDGSVYFKQRKLCVLGVQVFDINNHDLGDTTNAGPVVALKTPAS